MSLGEEMMRSVNVIVLLAQAYSRVSQLPQEILDFPSAVETLEHLPCADLDETTISKSQSKAACCRCTDCDAGPPLPQSTASGAELLQQRRLSRRRTVKKAKKSAKVNAAGRGRPPGVLGYSRPMSMTLRSRPLVSGTISNGLVLVKKVPGCGNGLFAGRHFNRGDFITSFQGDHVHLIDMKKRQENERCWALRIHGTDVVIDGQSLAKDFTQVNYFIKTLEPAKDKYRDSGLGHLSNSCIDDLQVCNAKLVWRSPRRKLTDDGKGGLGPFKREVVALQMKEAFLQATTDIRKGTEIRWKYQFYSAKDLSSDASIHPTHPLLKPSRGINPTLLGRQKTILEFQKSDEKPSRDAHKYGVQGEAEQLQRRREAESKTPPPSSPRKKIVDARPETPRQSPRKRTLDERSTATLRRSPRLQEKSQTLRQSLGSLVVEEKSEAPLRPSARKKLFADRPEIPSLKLLEDKPEAPLRQAPCQRVAGETSESPLDQSPHRKLMQEPGSSARRSPRKQLTDEHSETPLHQSRREKTPNGEQDTSLLQSPRHKIVVSPHDDSALGDFSYPALEATEQVINWPQVLTRRGLEHDFR